MKRRAIVTVITRNYAHFALALAESAREHHPECDFYVCMADEPPASWSEKSSLSDASIFFAKDLGIKQWRRFAFQYTPFELSCALKPYAIEYLIDRQYDEIVYLDSDMRLYAPLDEVFSALDDHSIVLTPHLLREYPDDGERPGEELFLMAGTYNAGFFAVRNDATTSSFVRWWVRKLEKQGYKDLAGSIFVDQKWLSLVPGMFDGVYTLRNPAYNTGHWTLPQFDLGTDDSGHLTIDEKSVVLFHFSNFAPNNSEEFLNCQTRFTLEDLPQLKSMVTEYHLAVSRHNEGVDSWGCEWDSLDDGTPIHAAWREAIRREEPIVANLQDPFATTDVDRSKFVALESRARKWRRDWRIKGLQTAQAKKIKKVKGKVKSLLSKVGLRKKKAA